MTAQEIKQQLNHVFDDDLHTKQWENYVDYGIIGLIVLSTLQIFLSTFDYMDQHFGTLLKWIDYITIVVFTIEVTLRIWCADLLDEKYKGFWGRVKYCFSFYGFLDFISTYSFYLALIFPIPYNILKVLRVARLLRIFRYMKAFTILNRAISSKKDEMTVSLQFLVIITLMLSFILFFVEHEVQPDVYSNGWTSVVWAFAQYIGDPGNFADTPPVTITGRIIACIIGILGIAIFAVPAGLIASGFSDAMNEMVKEETDKKNAEKIRNTFNVHANLMYDRSFWPQRFYEFKILENRFSLTEADVFAAVKSAPDMRSRLYNGEFVVELFHTNRSYGFSSNYDYPDFPKTHSNVTILCHNGALNMSLSYYAYQLARIGRFNLITNEYLYSAQDDEDYRCSILAIRHDQYYDKKNYSPLHDFISDIKQIVKNQNDWVFVIRWVSGKKLTEHQVVGLRINVQSLHEGNTLDECTSVNDVEKLKSFYNDLQQTLLEKHEIETYLEYMSQHDRVFANYVRNYIGNQPNVVEILFSADYLYKSAGSKGGQMSIKTIEEIIHRNFETVNTEWNTENWTEKEAGIYRSLNMPVDRGSEYTWAQILGAYSEDGKTFVTAKDLTGKRRATEFHVGDPVILVDDNRQLNSRILSITQIEDSTLTISLKDINPADIAINMCLTNNPDLGKNI